MRRGLVVIVGVVLVLAAMLWLEATRPPTVKIASNMLGESWYRVELSGDHVGFMYNRSFVDRLGHWHFFSTTHFLLADGDPNTITKHLIFGPRAPYPLIEARYANRQDGKVHETRLVPDAGGYRAELIRGGERTDVAVDWSFDMETFVAFETWLATERRSPDSQFLAHTPDFERLRVTQRAYRVVDLNAEGYLVETNAPFAATQTQLDASLRPLRLSMAGIFDVVAAGEADAIALKSLRRKTNYRFEVDQRLEDHTNLAELALGVAGTGDFDLPRRLELTYNPVTTRGDGAGYIGEELRYPVSAPAIQNLVRKALDGPGEDPVEQLLRASHEALRYAVDRPAGSVLDALRRGAGECTDYADLFTTLARAAGLPARTVYGLAYQDGGRPAFLFHAWNEVYRDGRWQSVDPTWNQTRVDATHLPLSEELAARFMLANNVADVRFLVEKAAYFED